MARLHENRLMISDTKLCPCENQFGVCIFYELNDKTLQWRGVNINWRQNKPARNFNLHPPIAFLFLSLYDMQGLVPLLKISRLSNGHIFEVTDRYGVLIQQYKVPFYTECLMNFWSTIVYNDILHRPDVTLSQDLVTELDLVTEFDLFTEFREVSIAQSQRVWLADRERSLLWTPGPVPFGTSICSSVDAILFETSRVSWLWISISSWYFYFTSHFCFADHFWLPRWLWIYFGV